MMTGARMILKHKCSDPVVTIANLAPLTQRAQLSREHQYPPEKPKEEPMASTETKFETLRLERRGHISVLTLDRPDRLNAFNEQLTQELCEALQMEAEQFPRVRVIILTGAGRGFCSGADVNRIARNLQKQQAAAENSENEEDPGPSLVMRLAPFIRQLPQPVIAAVNGVAAGAGLSLALACDIRIASEQARFASIFIKRSLVPDAGASQTIAALAGAGIAAEMALTGQVYDAHWALENRLVNRVVPHDILMEQAISLADKIALNPPLAIRATKQLLNSQLADLSQVIQREHRANAPLRGTKDQQEAVESFLEKREPKFTGS